MSYSQNWKTIEANLDKNPQSTEKQILQIIAEAEKNGDCQTQIKGYILLLNAYDSYKEEPIIDFISYLNKKDFKQKECKVFKDAILGYLHYAYFIRNRWKIIDRTDIATKTNDDIRTWTVKDFAITCEKYFDSAIKNLDVLQNISIKKFNLIFKYYNSPINLRPTVFDLVSYWILDFYTDNQISLTRPQNYFNIDDPAYFLPPEKFVNYKIFTNDTLSFEYRALQLYQLIEKTHLKDKDKNALVDAYLNRIKFVYNNYKGEDADRLYLLSLKKIQKQYPHVERTSMAHYLEADYYYKNCVPSDSLKKLYYIKAYQILTNLINNYKENSITIEALSYTRKLMQTITQKNFNLKVENPIAPNTKFPIRISYRNLDKIYLRIYSLNNSLFYSFKDYKEKIKLILKQKYIFEKNYTLPLPKDYLEHSAEIILDELKAGKYAIVISLNSNFSIDNNYLSFVLLNVSSINLTKQNFLDKIRIIFNDRTTGLALDNIKVNLIKNQTTSKKLSINKLGISEILLPKNIYRHNYKLIAKKNESEIRLNLSSSYSRLPSYPLKTKFVVFLDRKIYRPEQILYFKGLVYQTDNRESYSIVKNKPITIKFYDNNNVEIGRIQTTSDNFGGFSGEFVIPKGKNTGMWRIHVNNIYITSFRVEEYKKPQFYVEFEPIKETVIAGDNVLLIGKALTYNEIPLDNAKVEYSIIKRIGSFWRWWWIEPEEYVIGSGSTQTNHLGEFKINIQTNKQIEQGKLVEYIVKAKVTDNNGETHSAKTFFRVAKQSVFVKINVEKWLDIDNENKFSILAQNIALQEIKDLNIQYKIYQLSPPASHPLTNRLWDIPEFKLYTKEQWKKDLPYYEFEKESDPQFWKEKKLLAQGTSKTSQKINLSLSQQGVYKIVIETNDPNTKKQIKEEKIFYAFSQKKQKTLAILPIYTYVLKDKYYPGQEAKILIGTGYQNAHIFYQITFNDKILEEKYLKLNQEQTFITIPITREMINNFGINILLIKNNRAYYKKLNIPVLFSDKELNVVIDNIRDTVMPGEEISLNLKITDKKGKPLIASILASAYDASLDAFVDNSWHFSLTQKENIIFSLSTIFINKADNSWTMPPALPAIKIVNFYYPKFDWYKFNFYTGGRLYYTNQTLKTKPTMEMNEQIPKKKAGEKEIIDFENIKLRENFKEIIFFYPSIITDNNGKATIKFKIPDNLTKWHLQFFINTTNMDYAIVHKEMISAKEIMIYPNLPRFIRQGDQLYLSAKIVNNSDTKQNAKVLLNIKNTLTTNSLNNEILYDKPIKTLSIDQHSSASVNWLIKIPNSLIDPIEITIKVKTDNFSDAYQEIIPVLNKLKLITETKILPLNPNETKEFVFKNFVEKSKTVKNYRFELEFNSNPVWYAITSLPYIMEYPYECNEQIFSNFYANSISEFILNSDPRIKQVFESWKKTNSQALISPLEKKQHLKQIILEETPWLLEGKTETENIAKLSLFFDLNKMAYEKNKALNKLLKNQNSDGGWPWFPGMKSDWFITQYILNGFANLKEKNIFDYKTNKELTKAIKKAIQFADNQAKKYYKDLKKYYDEKNLKENHLSPIILHYLYMKSMYQTEKTHKSETFDYFYSQLKKYWIDLNLYSQALAALTLNNFGDKNIAQSILQSLKERSLEDKELGVYWAKNKIGWFWHQAPIETQATLIQAFAEINNDIEFVEKMKIWLLKNKQTNSWGTTKATAKAIFSLIFYGHNWLGENNPVEITIANQTYPDAQTNIEAGSGYFTKVWTNEQITPELGIIKAKNPNKNPTWGAAYWQYFEDINKVQEVSQGVSIQRKYYIVKYSEQGEQLQPISQNAQIKLGDEIVVRIILETDRAMEFLHLKDLRPAGFEPVEQLSGFYFKGGFGYYQSIRDASANFFIDYMNKGKYVFEYRLYATMPGTFSAGYASFQSMYAPEFSAHSKGIKVNIK